MNRPDDDLLPPFQFRITSVEFRPGPERTLSTEPRIEVPFTTVTPPRIEKPRGPKQVLPWPTDDGDVWCEECNYPLPPELEDGPGECPHCGIELPDRRVRSEE